MRSMLCLCWDEVGDSGGGRTFSSVCADSSLHITLNDRCSCSELVLHSHFLKSEVGIRSTSNMFLQRMSNFSHKTTESQNKPLFEGWVRLSVMGDYVSTLNSLLKQSPIIRVGALSGCQQIWKRSMGTVVRGQQTVLQRFDPDTVIKV